MALSVFYNSMVSGSSLATFDVQGSWTRMFLYIPTFTSQTGLRIEVATNSSTTYLQLAQEIPQTTTAQTWPYIIAATATSGGFVVPLPFSNFEYFRVRTVDSAPTSTVQFAVICSNSY